MKLKKILIGMIIAIIVSIIVIVVLLTNVMKKNKEEANISALNQVDDKTHVKEIIYEYQDLMNDDRDALYNNLDEEYKKIRFENKEAFYEYADKIMEDVDTSALLKFNKRVYGNYTQYEIKYTNKMSIIVNENNANEINTIYKNRNEKNSNENDANENKANENKANENKANENKANEKTWILDIHTVNTEYFKEQYEFANEEQKVKLNTEKIIDAFNTYDYKYIYSKLSDNFKKKNFSNLESFIKNMEYNPIKGRAITIMECKKNNNKYTQKVSVGDYTLLTIEMNLLDNMDFNFEFKVENLSN